MRPVSLILCLHVHDNADDERSYGLREGFCQTLIDQDKSSKMSWPPSSSIDDSQGHLISFHNAPPFMDNGLAPAVFCVNAIVELWSCHPHKVTDIA